MDILKCLIYSSSISHVVFVLFAVPCGRALTRFHPLFYCLLCVRHSCSVFSHTPYFPASSSIQQHSRTPYLTPYVLLFPSLPLFLPLPPSLPCSLPPYLHTSLTPPLPLPLSFLPSLPPRPFHPYSLLFLSPSSSCIHISNMFATYYIVCYKW